MLQDFLAILSGSLVGFVLGLIGGDGSILAVPLLVYVVGVSSPRICYWHECGGGRPQCTGKR